MKVFCIVLLAINTIYMGFSQNKEQEETFCCSISELMGKVMPLGGKNTPHHLRADVYDSFSQMQKAAQKEGISLQIASGYRSFERQLQIWNNKYRRYTQTQKLSPKDAVAKILKYSTIPGTSRHHWGTDLDLIQKVPLMPKSLLEATNFEKGGAFHTLKLWLDKNASKYGFHLVYTNNPNRTGFNYEPWHYTYCKISEQMLSEYSEHQVIHQLDFSKLLGKEILTPSFLQDYFESHLKMPCNTN